MHQAATKLDAGMTRTKMDPRLAELLSNLRSHLEVLARDKPLVTHVTLCAILSSGHILLEDVPGIGKTTFIKAIAKLLGLNMKRVQFTSDVLPSDIIGLDVYDPQKQAFSFHRGPLFSQIILADELNRASPRTQSALLEAMGEGSVTVNGKAEILPKPFMVFATQNPNDSIGTYPLPESQLDRFAAKLKLDYPSKEREEEIFRKATLDPLQGIAANVLTPADLMLIQQSVDDVIVADRVIKFIKRFVDSSRHHEALKLGVSTRGGVSWLRMAKAKARIDGRDYVIPDDLLTLAPSCLAHRILPRSGIDGQQAIAALLTSVSVD